MGLILKITALVIGIIMVYVVGRSMKKHRMSEVQSVFWLIGAFGVVVMGLFPEILYWAADIFGVWWPPTVLIFFLLVMILFILFNHAQEISVLRTEINELSMQLSLMKHEKEVLERKVEEKDMREHENSDLQ